MCGRARCGTVADTGPSRRRHDGRRDEDQPKDSGIPDSHGLIHGCFGTAASLKPLFLIDPSKGGTCPSGYTALSIDQSGAPGSTAINLHYDADAFHEPALIIDGLHFTPSCNFSVTGTQLSSATELLVEPPQGQTITYFGTVDTQRDDTSAITADVLSLNAA